VHPSTDKETNKQWFQF